MSDPKPKVNLDILQTRLVDSMDTMRDNLLNLSEALEILLVEVDPTIQRHAEDLAQKLLVKLKKD